MSMSEIAWFQHLLGGIESILSGMKALRLAAIVLGFAVVLYLILIVFLPEWIIAWVPHLPKIT